MFNLKEFVSSLDLEDYETRLREQGYDSAFSVFTLNNGDLDELGIEDEAIRHRLIAGVNSLDIRPWLAIFQVEHLYGRLKERGISTVLELKNANITDETMDEMDIPQPGFRKGLQTSVNLLRDQQSNDEVVAEGYWARPAAAALRVAHSEFLCVDGVLKSAESGKASEPMPFVVDTGSEAVTVPMRVIEELQLPWKGRPLVGGVHTIKEADAYGAILVIGGQEINVTVVEDKYASVGKTTVRNFRHVIDKDTHKWIRGLHHRETHE